MIALADGLDRVNRLINSGVRWLALFMALVQFGIVIGRYAFGVNSIAVQESVLYMHAALFMLTAGYTLQIDKHVRVDVFYSGLPERIRRKIDIFGHVFLLLPSMIALFYWSWTSVVNSWAILEGPIAVGGLKAVFLMKSLIPCFCVLIILQSIALLVRLLSGVADKEMTGG